MLMIKSLTKADIRSRGAPVLDFHLARKALTMRKEVGALEEVQEQCHPLNKMNKSQVKKKCCSYIRQELLDNFRHCFQKFFVVFR